MEPQTVEIILFWADWCDLSKKYKKKIDSLVLSFPEVSFDSIQIDNKELKTLYKISEIPTLVVKNASRSEKIIGYNLIKPIRSTIKSFLKG